MKINIKSEMAVVIAIMGLGTLAMSVLSPVMPLYLDSIGIEPVMIGLMLSVAMVGMAIGESFWGLAADRIGLRIPLITGTFICGVAVFLFVLTRNIAALFIIFLLWGFVRSALFGPSRGYIGANAPPLKKATFMAISAVMMSASRSLAALPSGYMVEYWGYHSVFYAATGVALLAGLLVVTRLRKTGSEKQTTPVSGTNGASDGGGKISLMSFIPQCVVTILRFFGLGATISFLPLFAVQVVGIEVSQVGILFTINGLINVVLGIPSGILADRVGKKTIMITGLIISACGMAGIAYSTTFSWLIVSSVVNGIGTVLFSPAALGLISDSVPLNRQSTAMGLYGGVCENVGIIIGSALGGVIWDVWGPQPTFLTGTFTAVLAALVCLALVRDRTSGRMPY